MIKVMSLAGMLVLAGSLHAYGRIEASAEWDKNADFRRLGTYAWLSIPADRMWDGKINYMLLDPRVKGSADIDLQYKGYQKTEPENADFLMGYQVIKEEGLTMRDVNGFYGFEPVFDYWGTGRTVVSGDTYAERYTRGTLILDVVDKASGKQIGRASCRERV